ncbi:hypothetical protein [Sphingosinicella rhizophila]|uniref:Uncharacterized protein n=1 Tax=Sphingosinicella rhizophila TaxID=3050082 RepID=A0ABU3QDF1_9SPHN|nr:hypothetical protein [Sphingosinicella sp. GR2756]MDT9601000.1 hypothetical protein [Sphingosinicella sp. GR2756]
MKDKPDIVVPGQGRARSLYDEQLQRQQQEKSLFKQFKDRSASAKCCSGPLPVPPLEA